MKFFDVWLGCIIDLDYECNNDCFYQVGESL